MRNIGKEYLCNLIKMECINLIHQKDVEIEDLSFDLGISQKEFYKVFNESCEDITIFLKAYDLLTERY